MIAVFRGRSWGWLLILCPLFVVFSVETYVFSVRGSSLLNDEFELSIGFKGLTKIRYLIESNGTTEELPKDFKVKGGFRSSLVSQKVLIVPLPSLSKPGSWALRLIGESLSGTIANYWLLPWDSAWARSVLDIYRREGRAAQKGPLSVNGERKGMSILVEDVRDFLLREKSDMKGKVLFRSDMQMNDFAPATACTRSRHLERLANREQAEATVAALPASARLWFLCDENTGLSRYVSFDLRKMDFDE